MRYASEAKGRGALAPSWRHVLVTLVAFVTLLTASLRVPPIVPLHAGAPSVRVAPARSSSAPELAEKPVVSCRVPVARPASRDTALGSLAVSTDAASTSCAPIAFSEWEAVAARLWTPGAKTRAELMVFLN